MIKSSVIERVYIIVACLAISGAHEMYFFPYIIVAFCHSVYPGLCITSPPCEANLSFFHTFLQTLPNFDTVAHVFFPLLSVDQFIVVCVTIPPLVVVESNVFTCCVALTLFSLSPFLSCSLGLARLLRIADKAFSKQPNSDLIGFV